MSGGTVLLSTVLARFRGIANDMLITGLVLRVGLGMEVLGRDDGT
jgi:hypothetical protein